MDSDDEIPKRQCTQCMCTCGGLKKYNACMIYDYKKWSAAVEKEEAEKAKEEKNKKILIKI
jgi:hypothetical protein